MHTLFARLRQFLRKPGNRIMRVSGVQQLAGGVLIYAIDVDGRRIILGASPHAICVLDRYRVSAAGDGQVARTTEIQRDPVH